MVDASYQEVAGLGAAVNAFISKNGAGFNPVTNAVAEISHGWYTLLLTALECNTIGPVSMYMTGAGCIQQNLEYVVQQRNAACINYTYTLTNIVTGFPVDGAEVWFTTDVAGLNVIWNGDTDAFGIARDATGDLPCLDAGTYYAWATKAGLVANAWPDTEIVS
jgi:hypothetical protein